ncbi:50S ribosomal protein L19-2, chloroplastic-like [Tripterygium wilfordii]|uniref:50S ribosomal protein L19-2, chloroplastic-like n=1 Tax=Tripterygium wilfordii TaxID=458696 RepID=UPI0018F8296A|nr:50S ribosomal protein L19-2, chloroplastic-like [Tripterygium wilfordii]
MVLLRRFVRFSGPTKCRYFGDLPTVSCFVNTVSPCSRVRSSSSEEVAFRVFSDSHSRTFIQSSRLDSQFVFLLGRIEFWFTHCSARDGEGLQGKRDFSVRAKSEAVGETGNVEEQTEASGVEEDIEAETEAQAYSEGEALVKEARPPRKSRIKLGEIMGILNKRAVEAAEKERPVPDIRTGDIVEINWHRLSFYKGIVMSRQNAGIHTTTRIRKIVAGVGVEIVFPLYSPNIREIKVLQHRKVRRARLDYLRDKLPRFSTFK